MERPAGNDPALRRWQRRVLPTRRWPRWCSQTDSNCPAKVRSLRSSSRSGSAKYGAGGRIRTDLVSGWKPDAIPTRRHPQFSKNMAPVSRLELAEQVLETRSRPTHTGKPLMGGPTGFEPACHGPQPRAYASRPRPTHQRSQGGLSCCPARTHRTVYPSRSWSRAAESNRATRATKAGWSQTSRRETGADGRPRTDCLRDTNAAFSPLNFAGTNWRWWPGASRRLLSYEESAFSKLHQHKNWRSRRESNSLQFR